MRIKYIKNEKHFCIVLRSLNNACQNTFKQCAKSQKKPKAWRHNSPSRFDRTLKFF